MNELLPRSTMPEWLKKNSFSFSLDDLLPGSLYYPASGTDGDPVKFFLGNVYSFIYVDYGVSQKQLENQLISNGFRGYRIIHDETIQQKDIAPQGWNVRIAPDLSYEEKRPDFFKDWIKPPFCKWYIFDREGNFGDAHNPSRFSLLFLCADGAASYQSIYLSNSHAPLMLAIIQPGHGFGGNWTNFEDRKAILARSVFHNEKKLPEFIVYGGIGGETHYKDPVWPEYSKHLGDVKRCHDDGRLTLWKKNS
jgi:hypothetical protein